MCDKDLSELCLNFNLILDSDYYRQTDEDKTEEIFQLIEGYMYSNYSDIPKNLLDKTKLRYIRYKNNCKFWDDCSQIKYKIDLFLESNNQNEKEDLMRMIDKELMDHCDIFNYSEYPEMIERLNNSLS